jgi:NitT/TauT family transport system substrate-binding protein
MSKCLKSLIFIALTLTLTACLHDEDAPIRIGLDPWPGNEFLFLAQTKGFFAEEGVPVRLVEFSTLNDVRRGFERGQTDGMAATPIEAIQANERSKRQPRLFMVSDYSNGADALVANDSIKTVRDLKGKRIAAEPGSLTMFLVARALETAGLTLDDVTIVPMDQAFLADAMSEGKVDAVATYPPTSIAVLGQPGRHVIFSSADIPGEVTGVMCLDAPIMRERPDVAAAIVRAWDKALKFAQSNPDEAYTFMAQRMGMSRADFEASLGGIRLVSAADQSDYFGPDGRLGEILAEQQSLLAQTGQMDASRDVTQLIAGPGPQMVQRH